MSYAEGKNFKFHHFWWPSWIFARKWKSVIISKTVRDRAMLGKFLTRRVAQECPVQRGKISIFATFGGHLGFCRKEVSISQKRYFFPCSVQWEINTVAVVLLLIMWPVSIAVQQSYKTRCLRTLLFCLPDCPKEMHLKTSRML